MPPTSNTKPKSDKSNSAINVKLLLIGNSSVGKSSLLLRFSDEQWLPEDEASATIGVDFRVHKMEVNGKKVKLSIWVRSLFSLAGSSESTELTRNALCFLSCCGRTRPAKNASAPLRLPTTAVHRG